MIADHLGLTAGTISAVLNNTRAAQRIPQHTRERIVAAARELHYQPNPLARALRTGKPLRSETTHESGTGRALVIVGDEQLERALIAIQQAGLRVHDDFSVLDFGEATGTWDFPSFDSAPEYPSFEAAAKPA
jgi:DNA-binding LacI/PurR family transcriptional regulator